MKKRTTIIAGVALAIVFVVLLVVIAFPQVAATRYGYFDVNNGRKKVEWVSFGRVYRESVEETEYSKLVREFGFEELPAVWKPAYATELGIRRFFHAQNISYHYGRVRAWAKEFTVWLELEANMPRQEKREQLNKFRTWDCPDFLYTLPGAWVEV